MFCIVITFVPHILEDTIFPPKLPKHDFNNPIYLLFWIVRCYVVTCYSVTLVDYSYNDQQEIQQI